MVSTRSSMKRWVSGEASSPGVRLAGALAEDGVADVGDLEERHGGGL
ncbi:MAG: hypothetical protein R3F14_09410 [Polyangiaceae bacterium]